MDLSDTAIFAAMAVYFIFILLGVIIYYIITAIGYYGVFRKTEIPAWKAFVPFLNSYELYGITMFHNFFWIALILSVIQWGVSGSALLAGIMFVANLCVSLTSSYYIASAFGKRIGYIIGLVLIRPLFMLMLGFGNAQYIGNQWFGVDDFKQRVSGLFSNNQ